MATRAFLRRAVKSGYNAQCRPLLAPLLSDLSAYQRYLLEEKRINLESKEATAGTISDVRKGLMKIMGINMGYSPLQQSREHLLELLPTTQEELPPRSMQDSFSSAIIPLSSDLALQDKYVTSLGHVRLGRLMEDMDIFAGAYWQRIRYQATPLIGFGLFPVWVANKHLDNPKMREGDVLPYVLVTVLVDKVDFTDYIPKVHEDKAAGDIRLSGHVSWVGNSSIEVVVWLEQKDQDTWHKLTRALFLMAARDSINKRAAFVNKLVPATEQEKEILAGGKARKERRQKFQKQSLLKMVPTNEEQQIIHDIFVKTIDTNQYLSSRRTLPSGAAWMEDAHMNNIIFSHPEDRNYHNKVFGGFLMRHALELSFASAHLYTKHRPRLVHVSDIHFHKPIDVNSLIRMHSNIIYTEHNCMQIAVHAEVCSPETDEIMTTNEFQYTYQINDRVKSVLPRTYHEAMLYLNGRRNFQRVMGLSQHR